MNYELSNGNTLVLKTENCKGMAGEPMVIATLTVEDKTVQFEEVKHLMDQDEAEGLLEILEEIAQDNNDSAVSFVI